MAEPDEFEAFVRRHQDMVYGVAVRMLADRSEAEDVSQTVFLKSYQHFGSLRSNPAAAGWLRKVATNQCLNHLNRFRSRWRAFGRRWGRSPGQDRPLEEMLVAPDAPDAAVQRSQEHDRLERAIRDLPRHQRLPLVLFHFEDRSYQQIAALLGISLTKVRSDIYRARRALRAVLEADGVV